MPISHIEPALGPKGVIGIFPNILPVIMALLILWPALIVGNSGFILGYAID